MIPRSGMSLPKMWGISTYYWTYIFVFMLRNVNNCQVDFINRPGFLLLFNLFHCLNVVLASFFHETLILIFLTYIKHVCRDVFIEKYVPHWGGGGISWRHLGEKQYEEESKKKKKKWNEKKAKESKRDDKGKLQFCSDCIYFMLYNTIFLLFFISFYC